MPIDVDNEYRNTRRAAELRAEEEYQKRQPKYCRKCMTVLTEKQASRNIHVCEEHEPRECLYCKAPLPTPRPDDFLCNTCRRKYGQ